MMKKVLFMLAMLTCIFASCSDGGGDNPVDPTPKPEEVKAEITIDSDIITNGLSFGVESGEQTVSFSVNTDWTSSVASTTSGATWCKASVTSGSKGTATVKFTVEENTGYDDRSVSVTIKAGSVSKTFTITQKGADALLVTTNKYEVAQEGGKIEVEVKANINYELAISETAKDWITESKSKSRALTTYKHTFEIAANEEVEKREGEITFKSGDKVETVKVYQAGGAILLLSKNEFTVSDAGETISVDVKSNVEYGVQMPDVDWITDENSSRGMSSHTLKYVIAANEGYDSRSAEIIFYDKNSDLKDTLKVVQAQKDAIVISQKTYEVEAEGETIEVKLSANVDFEVTMPEVDWIEQVESRGLKEHTLYFKITENTSDDSRSANIAFTNKDTQLSDSIAITQTGKVLFALSKKEFNVSDSGETISVGIKSSIEYGIQMPEVNWIKQETNTSEASSDTLKFIIAPNEDDDSRSAEIIFYDKNSDFKDTLKVIQKQKDDIWIAPQKNAPIKGGIIETAVWTNVDFDVHIPADATWISQIESRSTREKVLKLNVDENTGEESRTANIIISDKNKLLTDTLVIFQRGTSVTVTTNEAGSLGSLLGTSYDNDSEFIKSLKIIGPIDGDDCYLLRYFMLGATYDKGRLSTLDLSEASIEEGGWYDYKRNSLRAEKNIIGEYMFNNCPNLKSIILPKDIISIRDYAFNGCDSLSSITIANNVTEISHFAFLNCKSLTSITIPDSVTEIGMGTFQECTNLSSVSIGNGVTSIGKRAFKDCHSLTSVIIGSSVTSIGIDAFARCPKQAEFYCYATTPPTLEYEFDYSSGDCVIHVPFYNVHQTLYVPKGCSSKYSSSDWNSNFNNIIEMD